jgi:ferredoxin-type protein NapH
MKNKYLILRRSLQVGLLFLYFGANAWGWSLLTGNLSSSKLFGAMPLSDPFAVLQMLSAGAVLASDVLLGAVAIFILYAIVGGRVFCSWVCPVNMITDLANYLRRKLNINQVAKKQPASRKMRYWVLGLSFIISYFLGVAAFEFISPISMIHRGVVFGIGFGWAAALIIFLFDLFILKNGWCGHICPLGGFYSIVGKKSLIRVKHDSESCTNCRKCIEVCPESQVLYMINKESIPVLSGECTNCARCIEVCEDDSLNFSIRSFIKNKKGE